MSELRFDGCEVVRQLRAGPATEWYLARQASVGRSVVIKSLSAQLLPDSPFAAPLEREAQLLGQLTHENIVQLFDFKKSERRMWLVLEYIEGWTLEELLKEVRSLRVPCALALTRELLLALFHIHGRGVVHRDIHPRNILISRRGELKLSNFYLAAEVATPPAPELLEGDSGFPDLSYMSPEQILGENPDARSDLFSVGVVLYECIAGQRPFDAEDHRTTAQRIRHEPPRPLSDDIVGLTSSVERLLQRALSKLPSDRFADAGEFLAVLERALLEHGDLSPRQMVLHGLAEAGLIEERVSKAPVLPKRRATRPAGLALWVYAGCLMAFLAGVAVIERFAESSERPPLDESGELPLAPDDAARLRAVVRPWAHVFVDGQQVETTPFAHPIPLSPGVHFIRFEHPSTEPVRRRIEVLAGQSILLEVDMPMPQPDVTEVNEADLLRPPVVPDGGFSP